MTLLGPDELERERSEYAKKVALGKVLLTFFTAPAWYL
jgi:hypothetical protein